MREVHITQIHVVIDCASAQGLDRETLSMEAGLSRPIDELYSQKYVSWGDFARLLNAMERLEPDMDWTELLSRTFLDLPMNHRMKTILRHVSDPAIFFKAMSSFFGPYQFPCIDGTLIHVGGREFSLVQHIRTSDEYVYAPLFFSTAVRNFELLPEVCMGLPRARVTCTLHKENRPNYHILLPQSRSLFSRVKGVGTHLLGGVGSLDVLEKQVTEMKRYLRELDAQEVEKQARIETSRLKLDVLNAALLDARQESEAKSHYLANMSHELRTPLNAIIGGTEMVIEEMHDDGDTRYADDLQRINHAGRHLLGLIEHVLDLSKIEAGRMTLDIEPIELVSFIKALMAPMELLARQKDIVISSELGTSHTTIEGDALRLRQILTNLLGNALKFASGEQVCLRVRDVPGVPGLIAFEVEDHGIGIEEEALERLFSPFSQADASIHKRFGGTGLGLTIAREFALLMGGDLRVESVVGEGTTFTLEIPAVLLSRDQ